jgi:hypothetical protein
MESRKLTFGRPNEPEPTIDEEWYRRFVALQLKDFRQEPLEPDEVRFLAQAELMILAMPDIISELVMAGVPDEAPADRQRIAAASTAPLYDQVVEAMEEGVDELYLSVDDHSVAVLRLDKTDASVKPLYVEGYTFTVTRSGESPQIIRKLGAIHLSLDELRAMAFQYDPETHTIFLGPKPE